MTSEHVSIPRTIANQLLHLAQTDPDNEICGLIGSLNGKAHQCYAIVNSAEQPKNRFELDPSQQIKAMTEMRQKGEHLFAIYHSHPSSPAFPSATDVEMSAYPDAINLIISLNTKGVLELRGFKISNKQVQEIELLLTET